MVVLKTANRYAFSSLHKQRRFSILIILGIAFGMAALIIIIGIMNSLQTSQLSRLRNIESFDICISNPSATCEDLSEIPGVELAFRYKDVSAYALDESSGRSTFIRMRGLDEQVFSSPRFLNAISLLGGDMPKDGMLVGNRVATSLGLFSTTKLRTTYLKSGKAARVVPFTALIPVDGTYYSSSSDFSSSTCLLRIDRLFSLSADDEHMIGIYISDDGDLQRIKQQILMIDPGSRVRTWKESNQSLYSALMLEKYMVIGFLCFIILIVGFYLKKATARLIEHKRKETAELRALGLTKAMSVSVFIVQALEISMIGIVLGIGLGLTVSFNLTGILRAIDSLVEVLTGQGTILSAFEFKVSIAFPDIMGFAALILFCTLTFSFIGARKAFEINVMEILKDDTRN